MTEQDMKLKEAIKAVADGVPVREAARRYDVPASTVSVAAKTLKIFGVTQLGHETGMEMPVKTLVRTLRTLVDIDFSQLLISMFISIVVGILSGMFLALVEILHRLQQTINR